MKSVFVFLCFLTVLSVSQATFSKLATSVASEKVNVEKSMQSGTPLLYMVNNSHLVPAKSKLLEVDVTNKKFRVVTDQLNGMSDSVSGSALCGDNFFSVITDAPISFGLVKVNVVTGAVDYLDSKDFLFHKIECDPKGDNNTFIGTASQFTQPPTFSVQRYDATKQTATQIGVFPHTSWPGWDSIFTFDFESNKVMAAFAVLYGGLPRGSQLYEMDLTSGMVSGPTNFDGYHEQPVQSIFASGKDQFLGTFIDQEQGLVSLCKFDKSGNSVSHSDCKTAQGLRTMGLPYPVCNNNVLYTLTQPIDVPGNVQGLYATDINGFTVQKVIEIDGFLPYNFVGAMACRGGL